MLCMQKHKFLTAHWQNLIMANYTCNEKILHDHIPEGTEIDLYNEKCYISLVGFSFLQTKVMGLSIPFHRNFEEINLRFYVKRKEDGEWKRGVVFIREIVPKIFISLTANIIYGEKYIALPTRHQLFQHPDNFDLSYQWYYKKKWNCLSVNADYDPLPIAAGSVESFITEHYLGFTKRRLSTMQYAVEHPVWEVYPVHNYFISCDFKNLYGERFAFLENKEPDSILLAKGSDVVVRSGSKSPL